MLYRFKSGLRHPISISNADKTIVMQIKTKKIVFDLDGTLIDSICDITDACNTALRHLGFSSVSQERVHKTVGYGLGYTVRQFLPPDIAEEQAALATERAEDHYRRFPVRGSTVFAGVLDMLETLQQKGHELSVLSNKNQDLVEKVVTHFFSSIHWTHVFGIEDARLKKPNPTCLYKIIAAAHLARSQSYMVGDHNADALLARNASISFIGAGWGYYSVDDSVFDTLESSRLAHSPNDLISFI